MLPTPPAPGHPTCRQRLSGLALFAALSFPAHAQMTESAAPDEQLDVVELTPFEINTQRDVGYTATSSLAGGRTEADLKETPSAVSVLTREFLDDLAMTGMGEMGNWIVNSQGNTGSELGYEMTFRGLASSFPSRNYFVWYVNSDSFSTERLEFTRGPNGVLFGDGDMSGMVTTHSKRPNLYRERYSANVRADTRGGVRGTLDANVPVTERFGVRLNLLAEEGRDWRDRVERPRKGAHFTSLFRLTDNTSLRGEFEWGEFEQTKFVPVYWDNISYWTDPNLVYNGPGTPPPPTGNATGIARMATNTYIPALPELGFANWSTFSRTTGTALGVFPDEPRDDIANAPAPLAREFNLNAPDMVNKFTYRTHSFYLDHRFNENAFVQIAYNRLRNVHKDFGSRENFYNLYLDLNKVLPNGQPNPKFLVPYSENTPTVLEQGNMVDDVRALGTLKFDTNWFDQRFSAIIGSRMDRYDSRNETLYRVNGTNPNHRAGANAVRVRLYVDEPGAYDLGDINVPDWDLGFRQSGGFKERKSLEYAQLASTTRLFENRLTLHAGIRRDHLDRFSRNVINYDGTGSPIWGGPVVGEDGASRNVAGVNSVTDLWVTSNNAGGVYFVLPWLGVYANHSETFAPPTSGHNLLSGLPIGFSRSKGQDYGIKIVLAENKLSGSINYYDTVQKDRASVTNARVAELRRLWINTGRDDLSQMSYRDTQDLQATGWEFDFTANPTRSLRMIFNYALPETEAINLQPGLRAHFEESLPLWEAQRTSYLASPTDENVALANQMAADITSIRGTLDGLLPGVTSNGTPDYTANFYSTYTFRGDFLKNLAVGLGANFRGSTKISNEITNAFDYISSDSYHVWSGHISYTRTFGKVETRFQINVSNLLDNDDVIVTGYKDFTAPGQSTVRAPHTFRYIDPRKVTFSTSFTF